ncbi:hypothetical protein D3C86_1468200 [compost metagenome]
MRCNHPEHPVIGDETFKHLQHFGLGQTSLFHIDESVGTKCLQQLGAQLNLIHTVVAVDH